MTLPCCVNLQMTCEKRFTVDARSEPCWRKGEVTERGVPCLGGYASPFQLHCQLLLSEDVALFCKTRVATTYGLCSQHFFSIRIMCVHVFSACRAHQNPEKWQFSYSACQWLDDVFYVEPCTVGMYHIVVTPLLLKNCLIKMCRMQGALELPGR